MKIYISNSCQNPHNSAYPIEVEITSEMSREERMERLRFALSHDYVCSKLKDGTRLKNNFTMADCVGFDIDNDFSETAEDWITPQEIRNIFPDVKMIVHYSRNNMIAKNGKAARPKFHVLFPISLSNDIKMYEALKLTAASVCPYFDSNALDAVRMFFGTPDPQIELFDGLLKLDEFFEKNGIAVSISNCSSRSDKRNAAKKGTDVDISHGGQSEFGETDKEFGRFDGSPILEGERNSELLRIANRLLKRWGNTSNTRKLFDEKTTLCLPPLEEYEVDLIWDHAVEYYENVIKTQKGYIPPAEYNQSLKPSDYSDLGQAKVMFRKFGHLLCFTPGTGVLCYNGSYWEESRTKGQLLVQELTERQLEEAEMAVFNALDKLRETGAVSQDGEINNRKFMNSEQRDLLGEYESAKEFLKFVRGRRSSKNIDSVLRELIPMIEIDISQLDENEFLLNTPSATYDLRDGSSHPHDPKDYITKQTLADPSTDGINLWFEAVQTFFCGNAELAKFVQQVVGLAAVGIVKQEALFIAYGEGRNGKSTFWNSILHVLGSYGGQISADTLTVGCRRNTKPEIAELRGKRLVIAAELEEGTRLNTSTTKQICSSDPIYAEKKYKAPFSFRPTHQIVLYTNHLPKVGEIDKGTWRRLFVIPFNAIIEGKSDIKNYADFLFVNAKGAIMKWILDGAKSVIEADFKPELPDVVKSAIADYAAENNWLNQFLEDCCEVGNNFSAKSGVLYSAYRAYCDQTNNYTRSTTDFYTALESAGFRKKRTNIGVFIFGLRLSEEQ